MPCKICPSACGCEDVHDLLLILRCVQRQVDYLTGLGVTWEKMAAVLNGQLEVRYELSAAE